MEYDYTTPQKAIISLELAYENKNLEAVINSKDFVTEAKLILESKLYELNDQIIDEVSKVLELSLTQNLKENGYPKFSDARREFSKMNKLKDNIYFIEQRIFYPDNTLHINKVFLSETDNIWKVAMVEE